MFMLRALQSALLEWICALSLIIVIIINTLSGQGIVYSR